MDKLANRSGFTGEYIDVIKKKEHNRQGYEGRQTRKTEQLAWEESRRVKKDLRDKLTRKGPESRRGPKDHHPEATSSTAAVSHRPRARDEPSIRRDSHTDRHREPRTEDHRHKVRDVPSRRDISPNKRGQRMDRHREPRKEVHHHMVREGNTSRQHKPREVCRPRARTEAIQSTTTEDRTNAREEEEEKKKEDKKTRRKLRKDNKEKKRRIKKTRKEIRRKKDKEDLKDLIILTAQTVAQSVAHEITKVLIQNKHAN